MVRRHAGSVFTILAILATIVLMQGCSLADSAGVSSSDDSVSQAQYDSKSGVYSSQGVDVVKESEENSDNKKPAEMKKIYLTFDDGPSPYTQRILDILDEYDVKATFFVQGKTGDYASSAYKRIVEDGHTLGMHTFSHKYNEIYASKENFIADVEKLQEYLYEETGVWSRLYRFPGGSSNKVSKVPIEELIKYLDDQGIRYFDWNISSDDASKGGLSKERIIQNVMNPIDKYDECVILMHDALEKKTTVEALEEIIPKLLARGDCLLLPITDETDLIQHIKDKNIE